VIDGVLDLESGVTTVETQEDDELPHAAAWTESDVSHRPRGNRKYPVWLHDYDQHW
jgi:hypothetical protein